jgi:hypothetical protein
MEASVRAAQVAMAVGAGVVGERVGGDSDAMPELTRSAGVVAGEDADDEVEGTPLAHAHVMAIRTRIRPPRMPRSAVLLPRVSWTSSEVDPDAHAEATRFRGPATPSRAVSSGHLNGLGERLRG